MEFFEKIPGRGTTRSGRADWAEVKAELIANPEKWGLIAQNVSSSTPSQLRTGKNAHFRGEDLESFEFKVAKPQSPEEPYAKHRTDLYGRYVGKA